MPAADHDRREILDAATEVRDRLVRFVTRRVGHAPDAEDLVQSVFVRLQENVDRLDRPGRVVPWLFQVTRNALADHYRAESRRSEALDALVSNRATDRSDPSDDPLEAHRELAACLRPLIADLPEHYREALELVELDGHTQVEAAEMAGLSVSGMKSRVQRGRRMLRERVSECCRVSLDSAGLIMEYEERSGAADPCGRDATGCDD